MNDAHKKAFVLRLLKEAVTEVFLGDEFSLREAVIHADSAMEQGLSLKLHDVSGDFMVQLSNARDNDFVAPPLADQWFKNLHEIRNGALHRLVIPTREQAMEMIKITLCSLKALKVIPPEELFEGIPAVFIPSAELEQELDPERYKVGGNIFWNGQIINIKEVPDQIAEHGILFKRSDTHPDLFLPFDELSCFITDSVPYEELLSRAIDYKQLFDKNISERNPLRVTVVGVKGQRLTVCRKRAKKWDEFLASAKVGMPIEGIVVSGFTNASLWIVAALPVSKGIDVLLEEPPPAYAWDPETQNYNQPLWPRLTSGGKIVGRVSAINQSEKTVVIRELGREPWDPWLEFISGYHAGGEIDATIKDSRSVRARVEPVGHNGAVQRRIRTRVPRVQYFISSAQLEGGASVNVKSTRRMESGAVKLKINELDADHRRLKVSLLEEAE